MFASELALQERHAKTWSTYILPEASKDGIGFQPRTVIDDKLYALKFWEKKKESDKKRPEFPATFAESMSFIIARVCAPINITLVECKLFNDSVGELIWLHFILTVSDYLPVIYYIMFLSIYAPKEHLYCSKMVTIFYGCSMQIVLTGFFTLLYNSDILVLHLVFAWSGIRYNAPWNRCDKNIYNIKGVMIHCYELADMYLFSRQNSTNFVYYEAVFNYSGHYFQSSQSLYLRERFVEINDFRHNVYLYYYYFFVWIVAAVCINQLFKKLLWRVIDNIIWIMVFIYITTLFYTYFLFWYEDLKYIPITNSQHIFNLLLEMPYSSFPIYAPPIMHITLARTSKKKKLGFHSSAAVISIFFFKVLQSVTLSQLKTLSDARAGIVFDGFPDGQFPLLFLYPIFFKSLYLGPIFGRLFFIFITVWEFVTFIMVYHCLVEVVVCEWPIVERWHVSLSLCILGWAGILFSHFQIRQYLVLVFNDISGLTELFVIMYIYPLRRLKEDLSFYYYGDSISKIRMFTLNLEKLTVMVSLGFLIFNFLTGRFLKFTLYTLIAMLPVLFGALWKIFQKSSRNSLMRPVKYWGPSDYRTRQFRKHFDSRTFIGSMGPRYLCRHMLERAEQPSYRLDVEYADKAHSIFKSTSNILKDKLSKVSVGVPVMRSSNSLSISPSQQLDSKMKLENTVTSPKIDREVEKTNSNAFETDDKSTKDSFVEKDRDRVTSPKTDRGEVEKTNSNALETDDKSTKDSFVKRVKDRVISPKTDRGEVEKTNSNAFETDDKSTKDSSVKRDRVTSPKTDRGEVEKNNSNALEKDDKLTKDSFVKRDKDRVISPKTDREEVEKTNSNAFETDDKSTKDSFVKRDRVTSPKTDSGEVEKTNSNAFETDDKSTKDSFVKRDSDSSDKNDKDDTKDIQRKKDS